MDAYQIIKKAQISHGACRDGIVQILLQADKALSEAEIKTQLADRFDRTSFYRTFKKLTENGVIHRVVVDKGLTKYALTIAPNKTEQHAHFYCTTCSKVVCVDYKIPNIQNHLFGHQIESVDIILKGTCVDCN